jgi:tetratricopeptide (TPR) repeat protein
MIGRDKGHLSRVETGRGRAVTPALVRDYERALGVTITAGTGPAAHASSSDNVEDVRRRELLGGIGGIAVSVGAARLVAAAGPVSAQPAGDVELLRAPTMTYRRIEQRLPSRSVIVPVAAHLDLVRQFVARTPSPVNLYAVLSESAGLAAWLYADLDDRANAQRHYQLAIKAAQRCNDLLMCYMQASLGHYMALTGHSLAGLRLVEEARSRLAKAAPLLAAVWLDAIEAVILAVCGDIRALLLLDRAERVLPALADQEPVWPWVFRFDHAKLAGYRAVAASRLGRSRDALSELAFAAQAVSSPKQRAVLDVERAKVLAQAGQLDEACAVAVRAFDSARHYSSKRVLREIADFRSSLGIQRGATTMDLDDRLAELQRDEQ